MRKTGGKQLNKLLKVTPLVSDKKDLNTDLPDTKVHGLKSYASCWFLSFNFLPVVQVHSLKNQIVL